MPNTDPSLIAATEMGYLPGKPPPSEAMQSKCSECGHIYPGDCSVGAQCPKCTAPMYPVNADCVKVFDCDAGKMVYKPRLELLPAGSDSFDGVYATLKALEGRLAAAEAKLAEWRPPAGYRTLRRDELSCPPPGWKAKKPYQEPPTEQEMADHNSGKAEL